MMGAFDEFGKAQPRAAPAFLTDLFGARLGPVSDTRRRNGEDGEPIAGAFAGAWGDERFMCRRAQSLIVDEKDPAEVVATFASHDLDGAAAATRKRFGEGKALFVGVSRPDETALGAIVGRVLAETTLETCEPGPENLEVIRGDFLTGYLNLSDSETLTLDLPHEMTDLVTGNRMSSLELPPCGSAVFENPA
jgi:hypothetical protein